MMNEENKKTEVNTEVKKTDVKNFVQIMKENLFGFMN